LDRKGREEGCEDPCDEDGEGSDEEACKEGDEESCHDESRQEDREESHEENREEAREESQKVSALGHDGLPLGYPYRREDETTPRELRALLASGEAVTVVDCRTQAEADICKLNGAQLFPLQELERRMDELKASLDDNLATRIVVHCHHGRRSLTATYLLRAAGFEHVTSLAGGIHLWSQDIDPTMKSY